MSRTSSTLCLLAMLAAPILPLSAAEPANEAKPAGEASAAADQPFLGVVVRPSAESDFDGPSGLVVDRVFPRTTASELGLARGDVITRFNGQEVATREALKAILEQIQVGDKVTATYLREQETISGAAVLHARPSRASVSEDLEEAKGTVTELQQQRVAQLQDLEAAREEERTLAEAMADLSQTLKELPEKLDQTARQFKAVYPDGEFTVDITVRIRSHPQDDSAIDLSPSLPPREQPQATAPRQARPQAAAGEELLPPPTKK